MTLSPISGVLIQQDIFGPLSDFQIILTLLAQGLNLKNHAIKHYSSSRLRLSSLLFSLSLPVGEFMDMATFSYLLDFKYTNLHFYSTPLILDADPNGVKSLFAK